MVAAPARRQPRHRHRRRPARTYSTSTSTARPATATPRWASSIRAGLASDASAIIATPSGGLHAYFTGTGQHCGKLPRHHLDFRSQGGYVLAPPSQVAGKPYRLIRHQAEAGHLDWEAAVALLEPQRQATAARPASAQRGNLGHLAGWVAGLAPDSHNRNDGLYWAACRAAEAADDAVLAELAAAARSTGLTEREIAATIASARRTAARLIEHQGGREATS